MTFLDRGFDWLCFEGGEVFEYYPAENKPQVGRFATLGDKSG